MDVHFGSEASCVYRFSSTTGCADFPISDETVPCIGTMKPKLTGVDVLAMYRSNSQPLRPSRRGGGNRSPLSRQLTGIQIGRIDFLSLFFFPDLK